MYVYSCSINSNHRFPFIEKNFNFHRCCYHSSVLHMTSKRQAMYMYYVYMKESESNSAFCEWFGFEYSMETEVYRKMNEKPNNDGFPNWFFILSTKWSTTYMRIHVWVYVIWMLFYKANQPMDSNMQNDISWKKTAQVIKSKSLWPKPVV